MAGRSPASANDGQRRALVDLGRSRDRTEADRARAILLTLSGWTSPDIAAAFGVREDTVRLWRSTFMQGGVEALRTRSPPGPAAVKAERALVVATELLAARWRIGRTGPCRAWRTRSRRARACASPARGSQSCCGKGVY